jgi:hypothetical protein
MFYKKQITIGSCALNVTEIFVRVHMRHARPHWDKFFNARKNLCQIQHTYAEYARCPNVTAEGTHSYHWALQG